MSRPRSSGRPAGLTPDRARLAAVVASVLLSVGGCARAPQLLRGPIDIGRSVTVVRLEPPLHCPGPECELRFEFDRPGDSGQAGKIHVALVTAEGRRDTLTAVRLDRRGESAVSQIGRLDAGGETGTRPRSYVVLELWSEVPLRLDGIRGRGRP